MKKLIFLSLICFYGMSAAFGQQIMNNSWGYRYTYPKTFSNMSFQDIGQSTSLTYSVMLDYWQGKFVFNQVSFLRNKPGILLYRGTGYFTNTDFESNTGSALTLYSYNGNRLGGLERTRFYANSATNGGAIYSLAQDKSLPWGAFSQVQFNYNSATQKGGALYLSHNAQAMQDVSFTGNRAEQGGALYAANDFVLTGNNLVFNGNQATQGAAIFAQGDFTLIGGNITFSSNYATNGTIFAAQKLTLQAQNGDIVFDGNTGGAIYTASHTLTLHPTQTGNIIFNDALASGTFTRIQGDGTVFFNKSEGNLAVELDSGEIYLAPSQDWSNSNLTVYGGRLKLTDGQADRLTLNALRLYAPLALTPEVDVLGGHMDSLAFSILNGDQALQVNGFRFLTSNPDAPVTLNFLQNPAGVAVNLPKQAYDDVFSYQTAYDAQTGDITFTPQKLLLADGLQSAKAFASNALLQPVGAYAAAENIHQALALRGDLRRSQVFQFDNPAAQFYLRPFYYNTKSSFTNDAEIKNRTQGLAIGFFSGDLEWFDNTLASSGLYAILQQEKTDFDDASLSHRQVHLGGDLFLYSYRFFFGLTAQAGLTQRSGRVKGNLLSGGAMAQTGLNLDLSASELFLQPYVSYAYGYVGKGKDAFNGSALLTSEAFGLCEAQGGLKLTKFYGDQWSAYLGGAYIKQFSSAPAFYAAQTPLPAFELEPFAQAVAGLKKENGSHIFGLDVKARFGTQQMLEASLTLGF